MTMIKRDNQDMEMACRYTRLRDKKDNHQADIFHNEDENKMKIENWKCMASQTDNKVWTYKKEEKYKC
jgi:hypothetical protein